MEMEGRNINKQRLFASNKNVKLSLPLYLSGHNFSFSINGQTMDVDDEIKTRDAQQDSQIYPSFEDENQDR